MALMQRAEAEIAAEVAGRVERAEREEALDEVAHGPERRRVPQLGCRLLALGPARASHGPFVTSAVLAPSDKLLVRLWEGSRAPAAVAYVIAGSSRHLRP